MNEFPPLDKEYEKTSCGHKYYEYVKEALTQNIEVKEQHIVQILNPDTNQYIDVKT